MIKIFQYICSFLGVKKILYTFLLILIHQNSSYAHEINKNEIELIVKNFLSKNPEFIKSTLDNYQFKLAKEKKKGAINLLKEIKNPGIFQKNADITIFEFFDYNCGYCKSVTKMIMNLLSEDKKINFVFVEFPILSQQSYKAALAALASKEQGLYNDFHLSLMNIRGRIDEDKIFETAKNIGLNIDKLKNDMLNPSIQNILDKNREVAKRLGLNGTPAFIIGDIIYPGAIKKSGLQEIIYNYRKN